MKWLKKINQLFTHKELLDNSEQPKNVEQEAVVKKPQEEAVLPPPNLQQRFTMSEPLEDIVEKVQQQAETTTGAFRFPLIPDNEEFIVPPPMPERREERVQQQKAAEVDTLNIVLEPEPDSPGLRGVLQERKLGIHRKKQKPPRAIAPIAKKRQEPISAVRAMKEDPSFEHRRFVPSVVPSPVFGYGERIAAVQKPPAKELSTMNELLNKHKQQEPLVDETPQTSERQKVLTNKSILQTVEYAYEELPHVREARLAKEQPETTVEANDYVEPASPELMMHPDVLEQDIIRMPSLHNVAPKKQEEAESKDEAKSEEATELKDEAKSEEAAELKDEVKSEEAAELKDEVKSEEAAELKDEVKSEEATELKDEVKSEEAAEIKDEAKSEEVVAEREADVQPQQEPVVEEQTDEAQKQPEEAEAVEQLANDSEQGSPSFEGEMIEEERLDQPVSSSLNEQQLEAEMSNDKRAANENEDELFEAVCRFVYESQSASITAIKRQFRLNSSEAAPIVAKLEEHGYISEPKKGNRRDVLITEDELNRKFS